MLFVFCQDEKVTDTLNFGQFAAKPANDQSRRLCIILLWLTGPLLKIVEQKYL
jgi:hypothetical protein